MNVVKNIILAVIIFLLLVFGIKQQLDINALNKEISTLEDELSDIKYENEKKENSLNRPEDELMKDAAYSEGYRDPDAQIFIQE